MPPHTSWRAVVSISYRAAGIRWPLDDRQRDGPHQDRRGSGAFTPTPTPRIVIRPPIVSGDARRGDSSSSSNTNTHPRMLYERAACLAPRTHHTSMTTQISPRTMHKGLSSSALAGAQEALH
eukprot:scaffold153567_cov39-Tisochrysis_lutea.AAC.3